jgi:anti-sigma B factor antagonist
MKMTIEEVENRFTMINLDGRMDLEGTQSIDQKFAFATSTQPLRLAVDLSNVTFVASIGLRTLLTAARAQAGRGGKMVLVGPNEAVRKILEIAGVDKIVPILNDWETARARLHGG